MSTQLLFDAVQRRKRPEDVAENILAVLGPHLDVGERAIVELAARGALSRRLGGYTSMLEDFARPVGLKRQTDRAAALFEGIAPLDALEASDPVKVEAFLRSLGARIRKVFGRSGFLRDRLDRASRRAEGITDSRRAYNRKFRALARAERKLLTHTRLMRQYALTRVGKSGLATWLSFEELGADLDTACFVAYYASRCNLRSEFTISGQQRPFDTVAATLFERCMKSSSASFWAIAHVFPRADVLARLNGEEMGRLLARWTELLREIAELLGETWRRSNFARSTMIVRRGDDSTTWNQLAHAWNTAREHWMAIVIALGAEELFEHFLPGKVMSLDVAAWHRSVGRGLHPDIAVWDALPEPWAVMTGHESCTRARVELACAFHGVDASRGGWTRPRDRKAVVAFRSTPELVHGVTVGSPFLATVLKKAGVFSGKKLELVPSEVPHEERN